MNPVVAVIAPTATEAARMFSLLLLALSVPPPDTEDALNDNSNAGLFLIKDDVMDEDGFTACL